MGLLVFAPVTGDGFRRETHDSEALLINGHSRAVPAGVLTMEGSTTQSAVPLISSGLARLSTWTNPGSECTTTYEVSRISALKLISQ